MSNVCNKLQMPERPWLCNYDQIQNSSEDNILFAAPQSFLSTFARSQDSRKQVY